MATHVESPDGKIIEFPDSMNMPAIQGAMQRLYPPRPVLSWPPQAQPATPMAAQPTQAAPMPNSTQAQDVDKTPSLVQKGATDPGFLSQLLDVAKAAFHSPMMPPTMVPSGQGGPMHVAGPTVQEGLQATTGYQGYPQIYHAAQELGQGNKNRDPNAAMKGVADLIGGGMSAAQPLMLGAGINNPLPMLKGLLTSTATSYGAQKATEFLGGPPEAQELAAQLGGMLPMIHGTKAAIDGAKPEAPMHQAVPSEVQSAQGSVGPLLDKTENSWHEHKPSDIGPAPDLRAGRPGSVLDEYADMHEAKQSQAQLDKGRERFLNNQSNIKSNYSQSLGPAKTYDPVTGVPTDPYKADEAINVPISINGKAAGKASYTARGDLGTVQTAEVNKAMLNSEFRGKGAGENLYRQVQRAAKEKGFTDLVSDSVQSNEARKFWDRMSSQGKATKFTDRYGETRYRLHPEETASFKASQMASSNPGEQGSSAETPEASTESIPGKGLGPEGAFATVPEGKEGERGSFSFRKTKPTVYPSNSTMGRLANDVAQAVHTELPSDADTLSYGERMAAKYGAISDNISDSLHTMLGHTVAKASEYMRPRERTGFDKSLTQMTGDENRNNIETRRFVKNLIQEVPDKLRREGITNYMNAAGDDDLLRRQAESTPDSRLKRGYEVARNLTKSEKEIADKVRDYFETQLTVGQQHGFLHAGIQDYLPNVWKKGEFPSDLMTSARNYDLRPNGQFMKNRFFTDYFHGEQLGYIPKDKDIGALVTAYNQSFNKAVSSRAFVERLKTTIMPDGRPAVAPPAAMGKTFEPNLDEIVHIVGKGYPDEKMRDYKSLDHPALQGHSWATKSDSGDPIFYKGALQIHPGVFNKLENTLAISKWRQNPYGKAALKGSALVKGTTLSVGSFHQVQEGIHAIFHGVSPFFPEKIDLTDHVTNKLFDAGLMAGGDNGYSEWDEGLKGPGLLKGIPGIGTVLNKYSNYLFNDYIPRLKVAMAKGAYERNTKRYGGDLSDDQIAHMSAAQSNSAFGDLNYKDLGRSPTTQDTFRLIALAPDFLEARSRFVGEALKPYGAEQRVALVRGALGMYVTARILNKVLDDDYHYDKPFGLVHNGKEYELRSVPGDIYNLMQDKRSFVMHRLNPTTIRPLFEAGTGKDSFGRKRDAEEQVMDFVKNMVPIPAQGLFENKFGKGFKEYDWKNDALGAAGISTKTYRTPAATLARQVVLDNMSPAAESRGISYLAAKIQKGKYDPEEVNNLVSSGKMTSKDVLSAFKMSREPELVRNFNNQNVHLPEAVTIYAAAHTDERALLAKSMYQKMKGLSKLPPAEQADILKRFAAIKTNE